MKRFTLTFTILCAFAAFAYAGTDRYAGKEKEVLQPAPPPCEWYRAHEWNLDIWGAYAFSSDSGTASKRDFPLPEDEFNGVDFLDAQFHEESSTIAERGERVDIGGWSHDHFINRDGAWAGGADIKFFFSKYWALGVEGFAIDCNDNIGGAGLGTFTFRFPIGCSRFAPYVWGGFGGLGGGSRTDRFFVETNRARVQVNGQTIVREHEFETNASVLNRHADPVGQFGGGLEVRITKHIGLMGDFAWHVVGRDDNKDFGMGRVGVTLSY